MKKKLQVFVSSTYIDLIEERQAAVEAILDAGHIPAGMELFKAGKSQMKTIRKWIDESDVYMLILGGRYGSIEEESGLSYTELEYKYALSKNMPVFAIILDEGFLYTKASNEGKNTIFEKDNIQEYKLFKNIVKKNIVKFAKNIDQISSAIYSQLNDILKDDDYNLIGWIRADFNSSNLGFENYTFDQLNKMLENRIFTLHSVPEYARKIFLNNSTNNREFNAKEFFILNFNYFCNGPFKDEDKHPHYATLYNEIVPFFKELGILEEECNDANSKYNKAHITPIGMKLYAKLLK